MRRAKDTSYKIHTITFSVGEACIEIIGPA